MSEPAACGVPSAVPFYRAIERQLRTALARGEWKPGEAIAPERALAERFKVSIGTVRKAVDELCAAHLLIRQQGREIGRASCRERVEIWAVAGVVRKHSGGGARVE